MRITRQELGRSYRRGIRKGLFKIMSKMGISTVASYRSAQLFEIVGLSDDVVSLCFEGSDSRIQGADFEDLKADTEYLVDSCLGPRPRPSSRVGSSNTCITASTTCTTRTSIATLQSAVLSGRLRAVQGTVRCAGERPASVLHSGSAGSSRRALPVRFRSRKSSPSRRSCRALTAPACRWVRCRPRPTRRFAIAMNRLGARSNSAARGGEDPVRYGTEKNSKIKQVASGRFRCDSGISHQCRGAADQGGAGRQTRRGRSAAGSQSQRRHRSTYASRVRGWGSSRRRRITTFIRSRISRS